MNDGNRLMHGWFEEVWNNRDSVAARKYGDERMVFHHVDPAGRPVVGISAFLEFQQLLLMAFPDIRFTVEDTIPWATAQRCAGRPL